MKTLSVVIPCYNEEAVLQETYKRLSKAVRDIPMTVEFVFVNDGSRDQTLPILMSLHRQDSRVKVVDFARNRGHQIAVSAGIDHAKGDALVIIDADLQDPPELIPEMLRLWEEGNDVVYGQRRSREGETAFKKLTASLYYKLLQKLAGDIFPRNVGDFRLIDKKVADVIRRMPEKARYLRGMYAWIGFRQTPILFDRDKRFAGETHYPLKKMLKLAANGIISFSDKPLSLPLALGAGISFASAPALLVLLILILLGRPLGLWLAVCGLFLIQGLSLICIGILGRYLARVYDEVKDRPLYVVRETYGFEEEQA